MNVQFRLSKRLSKVKSKAIVMAMVAITVCIVFIPFIGGGFSRFWVDMFSPVSFRNVAYQECCKDNIGIASTIAYAIGLLIIIGIVIPVVTNHLRSLGERYRHGTLDKYSWKGHALFLGFDKLMIGTLQEVCEDARKHKKYVVVAVPDQVMHFKSLMERNLTTDAFETVEVIQCNLTKESDLMKKACIDKARRIYVIGQEDDPTHDSVNMKSMVMIADKWLKMPEKKRAETPHIMVYLRNQSTFSLLQRQGFTAENLWDMLSHKFETDEAKKEAQYFLDSHCEYFNFYCDKALRMLSSDPRKGGLSPDWHSENKNIAVAGMTDRQVHLVILGMTQMGTALVREALKLAHPSGTGTKMRVTMVDDNAYEEMHYFVGRTKELFKLCHYTFTSYDEPKLNFNHKPKEDFLDVEFEFVQCDIAHPTLTDNLLAWSNDDRQLLTIVICTDNSPKNMAVALYLPAEMLTGEDAVPTWVYQEGDDSVKQLLNRDKYPNLHPFSLYDHAVASTANSPMYERPRTIAQYYDQHYGKKRKWEEISQSDRWSSLYSVMSMVIKLRAVGITDALDSIDESLKNKKNKIDEIEHNRWMVEKLTGGFRPTDEQQHEAIVKELRQRIDQYPDWKTNDESLKEIEKGEKGRSLFKKLKNGEEVNGIRIHDDIRPFSELDEYTKYKDRKILEDYLESLRSAK